MIESFEAAGFGCVKQVKVALTPLHAFIGPNDSGKSTLLRALLTAINVANQRPQQAGRASFSLRTTTGGWLSYTPNTSHQSSVAEAGTAKGPLFQYVWSELTQSVGMTPLTSASRATVAELLSQLSGVRLLRLEPDALRAPSPLIPEGAPLEFSEHGEGLPGVYNAILDRGDDTFQSLAKRARELFPTIKHLRMKAVTEGTKEFEIDLVDGARVGAKNFSEGLLYYLAFAALPYLGRTSLVLIEEPENGLHPSRIADVMKILRDVSEHGTQVVLATHSPLVVNELKPEEVSIVTRTPLEGTKVTPISQTPNFAARSKAYALGELWLSYANGSDEAPLLVNGNAP